MSAATPRRIPVNDHVYSQSGNSTIIGARNTLSMNGTYAKVYQDSQGLAGGKALKSRYPHIKDLQAKADAGLNDVDIHTPVRTCCLTLPARPCAQ